MSRFYLFIGLFMMTNNITAMAQDDSKIVSADAQVELLAQGFSFTEGPASDREGNVYFTDQPNDRILKWSTDGKISTFLEKTGRANGLFFDRESHILSCSDMDNELWRIQMDGSHTVLVSDFEGKKLNGPNDVWAHPNGGVYFTDPLYVRDYWTRNPDMQQEGQYVYYLSPDRKKLIPVETSLDKPNGIVGTPDGNKLYVADIRGNKTFEYAILADGTLGEKKLFAPMGSDGMTIDEQGNLYLTGHGVTVFNASGKQILHIPIDAKWTANVCFGGKDRQTLFITASERLYGLRMLVKGVQ